MLLDFPWTSSPDYVGNGDHLGVRHAELLPEPVGDREGRPLVGEIAYDQSVQTTLSGHVGADEKCPLAGRLQALA